MSTASRQRLKAAGITLDDGPDAAPDAAHAPSTPRTAPGQLIGLQGQVHSQKEEIARLRKALENRAPSRLPLGRLHEVPGRRRKLSPEAYAELKANLEQYPLANPVIVTLRTDGDWDVLSGNNRVAIYRELDREDIEAVSVDIEPELLDRVAFFSNLLAPSLPDFEKYWNFMQLESGPDGYDRKELAKAVGLSESHVSRILAFDRLPEEAKQILASRPEKLGSTAGAKLAAASDAGRSKEVIEAVKRLVKDDKFTQDEAVRMVQAAAKPTPASARAEPLVIRNGKKKVVEITARKGVVGIRFAEDTDRSSEWAKKIHAFIESELKE